jgi:hypothetical protein
MPIGSLADLCSSSLTDVEHEKPGTLAKPGRSEYIIDRLGLDKKARLPCPLSEGETPACFGPMSVMIHYLSVLSEHAGPPGPITPA